VQKWEDEQRQAAVEEMGKRKLQTHVRWMLGHQ